MKHLKFLLVFLVLLMTGANGSVWAAVDDVFTANTIEDVSVTYKVLSESGTTGTVQIARVDGVSAVASDTESLTIPVTVTNGDVTYTVTEIGRYAFYQVTALQSVAFAPNSQVNKIGSYAFNECSNLQSITLPDCVETIGQYILSGTAITSINIPASMQTIPSYAFNDINSLQTIVFSENSQLKTIGDNTFTHCKSLQSISFPEGLETIGQLAFFGCSSIEEITIPSTVTSIGGRAFIYMDSNTYKYKCYLKKVTCLATTPPSLPKSDNYTAFIGDYPEDIDLIVPDEALSAYYSSWGSGFVPRTSFTVDGLFYKTGGWGWVQLGDGEHAAIDTDATEVTIPESVDYSGLTFTVGFAKNAFMGCTALTQLVMESLYAPGFVNCYGPEDVFDSAMKTNCTLVLPLGNEGYDYWASCFKEVYVPGDTSLKVGSKFTATNDQGLEVTYMITSFEPNTVKTYGEWKGDFAETAIPSDYQGPLTIPETVTYEDYTFTVTGIGEESFDACELDLALTEVTLPSTITFIENYAFDCCTSITRMNIYAAEPPIVGDYSALTLAEDAVLYVPNDAVESYRDNNWTDYFRGGINPLAPFVSEKFVVYTDDNMSIPVTYQITSLDEEHHTGTVQLYGWYGGEYIEDGYYKHRYVNCINNASLPYDLTIPSTVTHGSGEYEFTYTVTEVGDYAFTFLKEASCIIPADQNLFFEGCRIYLPSTITRIGKYAFSAMGGYSTDVLYAVLPEGVEDIDDFAFHGAFFLKQLSLPKSLKRIGRSAFEDCNELTDVAVYNPIPIAPTVWLEYEVDPVARYAFNKRPQENPTLWVPYGSKKKYLKSGNWGFAEMYDGSFSGTFFKSIQMMDNKDADVTTIEPEDGYSTDFAEEMVDENGVLDLEDVVAGGVYYNLKSDYENGFDDVEGCIVINNSSDMSGVSGDFDRAFLVDNDYSGLVVEVEGKGIVMIDCQTLGSGKLTVRIGDDAPVEYEQDEKGAISVEFNVTKPTPIYVYATITGQNANAYRLSAPRRSVSSNCVRIYSLSVVPKIEFSISSLGMGTFACNSALDFTDLDDVVEVYYATYDYDYDNDCSVLTFHRISKVPPHTGVLLVSVDGGAVSNQQVPAIVDGQYDYAWDNVFVQGTGETVSYSEDDHIYDYILFDGDSGLGFYRANNNRVATNRAYIQIPYLDIPAAPMANYFAINLEVADAITTMKEGQSKMANGQIYNLAGQRLNKLQRGLNIVNGKKVLVK